MRSVFLSLFVLLVGCAVNLTAPEPEVELTAEYPAPQLSSFFSDHMVVQRDEPIVVWGTAYPGQQVTVGFGKPGSKQQQVQVVTDSDGEWKAEIPAMPIGGPYDLSLSGWSEPVVRDVLVGDVWLCSGQSNMQFAVERSNSAEAALASANHENIRLFDVKRVGAPTPQQDFVQASKWQKAASETVKSFSAVCYYFAEKVHQETAVPLGLVASAWGGSKIEAWLSRETLSDIEDFSHELNTIADYLQTTQNAYRPEWLQDLMDDWLSKGPTERVNDRAWAATDWDDRQWPQVKAPGLWKNTELGDKDGLIGLRKTVELPEGWAGQPGRIRLGRAYERDQVWINGIKVGQRQNYSQLLDYEIPSGLLRAGTNVVAIQLLDRNLFAGGSLGQSNQKFDLLLSETDERISLAGDWRFKVAVDIDELSPLSARLAFDRHTPTALHNAMIQPLLPNRFKGVLWYQGEANSALPEQYARLLPLWAADWRQKFNSPELPFYIVQLPNFDVGRMTWVAPRDWPSLRNVQRQAALDDPFMHMAVTLELGEADDIHPGNKRDVGHRLAFEALRWSYGRTDVPATARIDRVSRQDDSILVRFADNIEGLTSKDGQALRTFSVCDQTRRQCQPVEASLQDTHSVLLSGWNDMEAHWVRYAWENTPDVNLYTLAGLPVTPFEAPLNDESGN